MGCRPRGLYGHCERRFVFLFVRLGDGGEFVKLRLPRPALLWHVGDRGADVNNRLVMKHFSIDDEGRRFETDVRINDVFKDHISLDLNS